MIIRKTDRPGEYMAFDREFWDKNGYIHVENAVPKEQLNAVIRDMETFTGKRYFDKTQWYAEPLWGGGMVDMVNTQSEWDNRQTPAVHEAFAGVWGQENLFVTINRTNFNPPVGPKWDHPGFIHWDLDPALRPIELRVQGVLYLSDTDEDMGGFQCVPGSHKKLQEWHETHPEDEVPTEENCMKGLEVKRIAGKAGDLVIWQASLLHGNGKNTSDKPRLAQYICMTPENTARSPRGLEHGGNDLRHAKVELWRLAPYQREVAKALDVPESYVQRWVGQMIKNHDLSKDAIPVLGRGSDLSQEDYDRLLKWIDKEKPWGTQEQLDAQKVARKYHTTTTPYPPAMLARDIGVEIERMFGVALGPEPPHLSSLGKRLLGAVPWG
jgi:ectoine hydroxylase-related dioxygenase (phytanoyl-CoA dioxygenase family)